MEKLDLKNILFGLQSKTSTLAKLFSKKIDSFLIIEISTKLSILSISNRNGLKVNAFKSFPIPKDKRDEAVSSCIKDFIKENNVDYKNTVLNPSLESTLIKRIQIPAVPDSELFDAVKWQIKDDISFDVANAVIDYSVIKKTTKEDGSKILDIIAIAVREEKIKQQVLLLKQAGLDSIAVNISPFGYLKIIEQNFTLQPALPLAALNIDDSSSYLAIYKDNKFEFFREIPISIDRLKDSLKGVLATQSGKIELSSSEIDEIISSIGIPLEESSYKNKINYIQLLSLMRPVLERLIIEVKRSLSYYDTEYGAGLVKKIMIAGGGVKIPNFEKFLAKELRLDVENIALPDKFVISSAVNQSELSECLSSLGLVLDYEKQINLLPFEFRTQQIENVEKVSLRWVVFIAVLFLTMSFLFTKVRIGILNRNLNNAKFQLSNLMPVKEFTQNLAAISNFTNNIKKSQPPLGAILKKLSNIAGKEIFFYQLSVNCESKDGFIRGFVKTLDQNPDAVLTEFISSMKNSGYFSNASIANVSKEKKETGDIAVFNINFKLK
ncbi:MAG TPA: pilus assembly protein PilM [Candidatus Omnitrophota bacterium]|nr:pilus assembly protein PilM [Candidatus Omnitrophota bacterium]